MTTYTVPHSLPVIEPATDTIRSATGDNLWKQINALASSANNAISAEGGRAEGAAKTFVSEEVAKDRSRLGALETTTVPKVLADAKTYADVEVGRDRTRLGLLEATTVPKALSDAKAHADAEVAKDRTRLTRAEAADVQQTNAIRQTLRDALAYADSKAADIQRELDTSHIALDTDGTPYYRPGSMTVKILQDTDGTPFYEAA